jgi:hypothetical protein
MTRPLLAALFLTCCFAQAQEQMTAERFREIAGSLGDAVPLAAELRELPFWPKANLRGTLCYADGRRFEEVVVQTTKSVRGRYLVIATESKLYEKPMYSIVSYDPDSASLHQWSIYGDVVVDSVLNVDVGRNIYAQSSSYGDGFTELTVGSYTKSGSKEKTLVWRAGKLFLLREVEARVAGAAK